MRAALVIPLLAGLLLWAASAWAQAPAMPPPHDPNDYPNPYHEDAGWAQLDRRIGGTSAVDMDPDGKSVWVFERCGTPDDGCSKTKDLDPVHEIRRPGQAGKKLGQGRNPLSARHLRRPATGTSGWWKASRKAAWWPT